MAVQIIKPGNLPWQEREWRGTCIYCQCVFSFLGSDAERWSSCRNEEGLKLPCPCCGKDHHTHSITPPPTQGSSR
jgi:hypothetical protein